MRKNSFILSLVLFAYSDLAFSNFDELMKGISVNDSNIHHLAQTSWEYAKSSTTQKKFDDGFAKAFIKVDDVKLFSLSRKPALYLTNFDTREVMGNWPLTPWEHYSQPSEIEERVIRWGTTAGLLNNGAEYPVGCLNSTPLRYGDIENDGKNELILIMGNDFIVFSPSQGKTQFSTWLSLEDWYTLEDGAWYFEDEYGNDIKKPSDPQYESRLIHNRGPQHAHAPGIRGYGKIYFGDFNQNQKKDLIVWHKIYKSKLENDTERGFNLLRNQFTFFEKSNDAETAGEYIPQINTEQDTIQGWLTANNLTWQKGFPSKSECKGQEGELIPEMHDPLLNDPDVLK